MGVRAVIVRWQTVIRLASEKQSIHLTIAWNIVQHIQSAWMVLILQLQHDDVFTTFFVLQIRRGNGDNSGIIFNISP